MKNVIILGSGRSGTSLSAGLLAKSGYFMGKNLIPGRDSNPKGFFESPDINAINEELLAQVIPSRPKIIGNWFFRDRPRTGQRWVAVVPLKPQFNPTAKTQAKIKNLTSRSPYCFKDPRFSYTLPVWRPFLNKTVFVVVFRNPAQTVNSVLKECRHHDYMQDLRLPRAKAFQVWQLMYSHILDVHQHNGQWLFIHFNQLFQASGQKNLSQFTGATLDRSFADPKFKSPIPTISIPKHLQKTYQQLCRLANYDPKK